MTAAEARKHNMKRAKWLCEKHGCSDKIKAIHFDQIVNRAWNPHPSAEFVEWWKTQQGSRDGVDAVRARNCKCYVDEYKEAIELGLARLPIDYPA